MEKIELKIEGMHCNGCSTRLEKILSNTKGVKKAVVNFENKIATIEYDSKKLVIQEIYSAVEDAGFEVRE